MDRSGSHRNIENLVKTGYWKGSPPHVFSETLRGWVGFRKNRELRPPRERPRGGCGNHPNGGMGASAPIKYLLT